MAYEPITAPMRIQALRGSLAEQQYRRSALPGTAWSSPKAIAPGVSPRPLEDLIFHGGKTLPEHLFQNIYLGSKADWQPSDIEHIDHAITLAMEHRLLNNVMRQYFDTPYLSSERLESMTLDEPKPVFLDEPNIQAQVVALYRRGAIAKRDLDKTIFNLILPRDSVLALGDSNSLNGLGGYHGSLHLQDVDGPVTLYYSANVYSEGRNGIPVFDQPWKNVVGTLYHELNEFRTDADVNDAIITGSNDFLGWMSRTGKEVGDDPIIAAPSLDRVFQEILSTTGNTKVPVQFMYSNRVHGPEGPVEVASALT
jgi:hypothetical protein